MSDRDAVKAIALLREAKRTLADRKLTAEDRETLARLIDSFLKSPVDRGGLGGKRPVGSA